MYYISIYFVRRWKNTFYFQTMCQTGIITELIIEKVKLYTPELQVREVVEKPSLVAWSRGDNSPHIGI